MYQGNGLNCLLLEFTVGKLHELISINQFNAQNLFQNK